MTTERTTTLAPANERTRVTQRQPTSERPGHSAQLKSALREQPLDVQLKMIAPPDGGDAVQRRGGGDGTSASVHEAAAQGIQGGGGAMPYLSQIQRSFGAHDVSGVQAHTGSQAQQANAAMGAEAYATGDHVAFGKSPDLHTAAHEAAHVVQQRGGVSLAGGVGEVGDGYEQHADKVADTVVKGESAEGLLDPMAGGGGGGGVQQRAVQHYKQYPAKGEDDGKGGSNWKSNGAALRVAEDGTAAVEQPSMFGSDKLYVDSGKVPAMNSELLANKVPLKFATAGGSVTGVPPAGGGAKTLSKVTAVEVADDKKAASIPDDCGRAAHTVTGATASGATLKAEYKDAKGTESHAKASHPEIMKLEIIAAHFEKELPNAATLIKEAEEALWKSVRLGNLLSPYQGQIGDHVRAINLAVDDVKAARLAKDADAEKKAFERYHKARDAYDKYMETKESTTGKTLAELSKEHAKEHGEKMKRINAIFAPYEKLSDVDKDALDKKAGINRYADPSVGQAYTVSSGGAPKSNMTWNYHWGGVIMKAGSDNVTMEGYAGSVGEIYYQIYGVPSATNARKGQTFHEQTRDEHQQHGDAPTTMATDKR